MKTVSIFTAAALLVAGAANAQTPTNQYGGATQRTLSTPTDPKLAASKEVTGATPLGWSTDYAAYSQDSYINQVGSGNSANVDQSDNRSSKAGGGSTAILDQTGDYNIATQKQTLTNTPFSNDPARSGRVATGSRDFVKSTQAGTLSESNQTQNGGGYNTAIVLQGPRTTGNRAIQTQYIDGTGGDGNQATINQTNYPGAVGGSGNRAEQTQSGIGETAKIDQESSNSYAKQTQSGGTNTLPLNNAYIHQGEPGNANTAKQTQSGGQGNVARIQQSFMSSASNNYAEQNQTGSKNQADIIQESDKNYAAQQQQGTSNYAKTTQQSVSSASYITQNGMGNSATVLQH